MWRSIHSWIGLVLALLVMVLAMTGTILATEPLYNAQQNQAVFARDTTVASALKTLTEANPRITPQRLKFLPSGEVKLSYSRNNRLRESAIDLNTGKFLPPRREPKLYEWTKTLHRSFFLGEKGRWIAGLGGLAMAILLISGVFLLLRRLGGIGQFFAGISWRGAGNQHSALGRLALVPLILTTITALWLSAVTLHLVSTGEDTPPAYPESLKELDPVEPWQLHGLQEITLSGVKEIVYPIPEDWFDVWTVQTASEYIFIDQFTGDVLSRQSLPIEAKIMAWVMFLHTAEGSSAWALVLLLSSLSVPFFAITGVMIWWRSKRQGKGRIKNNASAAQAEMLIAVGSEGGSTWRFAKALHRGLCACGVPVRVIEMNALERFYPKLKQLLLLTATYGDGDAPKSATRFLTRLAKNQNNDVAFATLAFGDKAFPAYCAFGDVVEKAAAEKFARPLPEDEQKRSRGQIIPLTQVDKQSAQTFSHWCADLGAALGLPLEVDYQPPKRPKTYCLTLMTREIYGESLGTKIAVLRFHAAKLPKYKAGDLVAVYPPDCDVPRLYSLGGNARGERFLDICVREQIGGLCSPWLCSLETGAQINVVIQENPRFHLPKKGAVVMVGAGTGIAPFTGMIRANDKKQPLYLYWGGRDPKSDALYHEEIDQWLRDGRLHHFSPAWSRVGKREYVQDRLRADRERLKDIFAQGATIMVCGGLDMAQAVRAEVAAIAETLGTSVAELKRARRYLEDVY